MSFGAVGGDVVVVVDAPARYLYDDQALAKLVPTARNLEVKTN